VTHVTVTVAGVSKTVTIEVFDLSFINEQGGMISDVQIEGIVNGFRHAFSRKALSSPQEDSLFRLRADLPGVPQDKKTIKVALIHNPGAGNPEQIDVDLSREGTTHIFLSPASPPFLAIPMAIGPGAVTPAPKEPPVAVIRARAGDQLRLDVNAAHPLVGLGVEVVKVRGRVVHLFARILKGADFKADEVRKHVDLAREIWSQAGIEVKLRDEKVTELTGFDQFLTLRFVDREKLGGPNPSPPRSVQHPNDIHVYYVQDIEGDAVGITISQESTLNNSPNQVAIAIEENASLLFDPRPQLTDFQMRRILAHELGHALLVDWLPNSPEGDHQDLQGTFWDPEMLMNRAAGGHDKQVSDIDGRDIDGSQVQHILTHLPPFVELL
jgi:hypothetical protein